jgi:hypothetical protein
MSNRESRPIDSLDPVRNTGSRIFANPWAGRCVVCL